MRLSKKKKESERSLVVVFSPKTKVCGFGSTFTHKIVTFRRFKHTLQTEKEDTTCRMQTVISRSSILESQSACE